MAEPEINAFLTHLALRKKVAASTQNQALSALLFLYRYVIGREVGDLVEIIRARKPVRLPVVMTRNEVKAVLANLNGDTGSPCFPNRSRRRYRSIYKKSGQYINRTLLPDGETCSCLMPWIENT